MFFLKICNLIVFHPIFYLISFNNQSNGTTNTMIDIFKEINKISKTFFIGYDAIFAFVMMLTFSILLVHTMLKSRLRILRMNNHHSRNRLKKDIRFGIWSVIMNLLYKLACLPSCLFNFRI